ncbi:MAG: MCP four helix bundle domain-containing protein [Cyclobacteriaceae bacterium]|nr:MCP four helix bundle domain-containing protein [Cyclobacteriaceae bacterium]
MKWLYVIQQKARVAFLLGIIVLLVFLKSLIDRQNVSELGNSFSSIYEDRLLVESYIYKLSAHLYQKQLLMEQCSQPGDLRMLAARIAQHNQAIFDLIQEYEKTKLTTQESAFFEGFKKNMNEMVVLEAKLLDSQEEVVGAALLDQQFVTASQSLSELSIIQIEEGKNMANQSREIVAGSIVLTQFELAMLIVIGLIIQALIFASRSISPKILQKHHLN